MAAAEGREWGSEDDSSPPAEAESAAVEAGAPVDEEEALPGATEPEAVAPPPLPPPLLVPPLCSW